MTIISSGPLIGPVLAAIRAAAGITQQELADRTGVAGAQISTYEVSKRVPDLDTVVRLLSGLGHRIVILPTGHAIGQQQRQAVIDAAVRLANTDSVPIFEMVKDVEQAVQALPGPANNPADNPYAEIAELRSSLEQAQRRESALRALIATAVRALGEADGQ